MAGSDPIAAIRCGVAPKFHHRPRVPEQICFTAVHFALTTADGEGTIPEVLEVALEFLSFRSRRRLDRRSNHVT